MIITETTWQESGYRSPWLPFDSEAILNFSFDFGDWVDSAGTGLTLASVVVHDAPGLTVAAPAVVGSVATTRIEKTDPAITADVGKFMPFTLRATLSDGQRDDRTFYLQIRQR